MRELVDLLNGYRNEYYNENKNTVSDAEYDRLFDQLKQMEKETGVILPDSPTITVGYEVKSKLEKVKHNHPMLSLDKTHDCLEVCNMFQKHQTLAMLKMDGLTVSLRYVRGNLVSAETRGDGIIGEDVTHNAKAINNIPKHIEYKEELIVDGEVIINKENFNKVNNNLPDGQEKYKNQRNLAAGSLRQLDSKIASERGMEFVAWKVVKGFDEENSFSGRLVLLKELGFTVVPKIDLNSVNKTVVQDAIQLLQTVAIDRGYPIDGIVFSFDDIKHGDSLGVTGHHPRNQIAYKFSNITETTILNNIRWQVGKTGQITPVAEFDPVELYGTTVTNASLHNISIMKALNIATGKEIEVTKSNEIIPQVVSCNSEHWNFDYPKTCPECERKTILLNKHGSEVLMCNNPCCKGKLLGRLKHFVSRKGMYISGLSDARLEFFMNKGWLNKLSDLYSLKEHEDEIVKLDKMGVKITKKLLDSIEESKNCTIEKFLCSLSIDGIGSTQSKWLAKHFNHSKDKMLSYIAGASDYTCIDGIGSVLSDNINNYMKENWVEVQTLISLLNFPKEEIKLKADKEINNLLEGKTFVVTGSVHIFKNRDEVKTKVEKLGGKVVGSVTKKTDYLICNEPSNSGKYKKATELGVSIITEDDLVAMIK